MDAQSNLAVATGAPPGLISYQQGLEARSAVERTVAKSGRTEKLIAVEASRLLEDVRVALDSDLATARSAAGRLAELLASELAEDDRAAPARGGLAPWQEHKIRNYIADRLDGPILVGDLAKLVALSLAHFGRAFKASFGESPHAYIIGARIERARTFLLGSSESLSQIALACGLADQAHFCRRFRQVTGTTPGAWRRRHAMRM